jgi:hypothetical protein
MDEARIQFSKNMIIFCRSQGVLWQSIYEKEREALSGDYPDENQAPVGFFPQPAFNQPQAQPRPHNNQRRALRDRELRARVVHVLGVIAIIILAKIRGYMLWFSCLYCVLVMFGLPVPVAREGAPPPRINLDTLLSRLKMQTIAVQRVKVIQAKLVETDEELSEQEKDQLMKDLEFLKNCEPKRSWYSRAFYQLVVLLFLTLLPSCSPDPELMK